MSFASILCAPFSAFFVIHLKCLFCTVGHYFLLSISVFAHFLLDAIGGAKNIRRRKKKQLQQQHKAEIELVSFNVSLVFRMFHFLVWENGMS